jgi:hypothetical protein
MAAAHYEREPGVAHAAYYVNQRIHLLTLLNNSSRIISAFSIFTTLLYSKKPTDNA